MICNWTRIGPGQQRDDALIMAKKHIQQCLDANRPDELDGLYFITDGVIEHRKMRDHIDWIKSHWDKLRQ